MFTFEISGLTAGFCRLIAGFKFKRHSMKVITINC